MSNSLITFHKHPSKRKNPLRQSDRSLSSSVIGIKCSHANRMQNEFEQHWKTVTERRRDKREAKDVGCCVLHVFHIPCSPWFVRGAAAACSMFRAPIRHARTSFENFGCERGLRLSTHWQWSVMVTGEQASKPSNRAIEQPSTRPTGQPVHPSDARFGPSPGIIPSVTYSHVYYTCSQYVRRPFLRIAISRDASRRCAAAIRFAIDLIQN